MRGSIFAIIGAGNAFLAVVLGAFGAHGLKQQLGAQMLQAFETGVRYQMYHGLALILVGILFQFLGKNKYLAWSGIFFTAGIFLFSGSLYILAISGLRWIGVITPLGGFSFLVGWLFLLAALLSNAKK